MTTTHSPTPGWCSPPRGWLWAGAPLRELGRLGSVTIACWHPPDGQPIPSGEPHRGHRRGGAGKTRLARTLGHLLELPVIHLDAYSYGPGWRPLPPADWAARQRQLFSGQRWVAAGNYASTLALRLEHADTIILLDLPPLLCAWQVLRRWAVGHRRPAPALPAGLPQDGSPVPGLRARFPPPSTPRPAGRAGPLVTRPGRRHPAIPPRRQPVHRPATTAWLTAPGDLRPTSPRAQQLADPGQVRHRCCA
jgi:hypothetical protein